MVRAFAQQLQAEATEQWRQPCRFAADTGAGVECGEGGFEFADQKEGLRGCCWGLTVKHHRDVLGKMNVVGQGHALPQLRIHPVLTVSACI